MKAEDQLFFQLAEKALQEAVDRVVEEARRTHSTLVVWEDGAVREIHADQLPPATVPSVTDPSTT
jgi:hypothetical protein